METGMVAAECFRVEADGSLDYPAILLRFVKSNDSVVLDTFQARELMRMIEIAIREAEARRGE